MATASGAASAGTVAGDAAGAAGEASGGASGGGIYVPSVNLGDIAEFAATWVALPSTMAAYSYYKTYIPYISGDTLRIVLAIEPFGVSNEVGLFVGTTFIDSFTISGSTPYYYTWVVKPGWTLGGESYIDMQVIYDGTAPKLIPCSTLIGDSTVLGPPSAVATPIDHWYMT